MNDIIDIVTILNIVLNESIANQKTFYEFIKKELETETNTDTDTNTIKMDTNLATIITILSNENLVINIDSPEINAFKISEKIEFNNLLDIKEIIDNYKIYYNKLDEQYSEFDKAGSNKSFSVFQIIKKQYIILQNNQKDKSCLFFEIIDNIKNIILNSKNYTKIPYEESDMCVSILVVDAFIRCKIFKNPEGYNHVIT